MAVFRFIVTSRFALVLVAIISSSKESRAQLSLAYYPPQITYGCAVTYSLIGTAGNNTQITQVQWRYQQNDSNCISAWTNWTTGNGFTYAYYETRVGTQTVQALVTTQQQPTYQNPNPPGPSTQTLAIDVNVPKPDGISIQPNPLSGTANVQNGAIQFPFPVLCQGQNVCMVAAGSYVKENLTNQTFLCITLPNMINTGNPKFLFLNGQTIIDTKYLGFQGPNSTNAYNSLLNGALVSTLTQNYVLYIPNLCGGVVTCPLSPSFTSKCYKVDNNNFKYVLGN